MTARDTDWDGVRLHVVTGKGGTGKTTVAAALALALAHSGRKILLIEAEGRQGIARIFDRPPLPYEERKIAIGPGGNGDGGTPGGDLYALAIDPEGALLDYLQMFYNMRSAGHVLTKLGMVDFATTIAPGLADVLVTGKATEAARRKARGHGSGHGSGSGGPVYAYDAVVMDAPPTGRIGRFLNVTAEVSGLAKVGPIRSHADTVAGVIKSPQTAVHFVSTLEEMPVQETLDGIAELRRIKGIQLGGIVINMARPAVLPPAELAAPPDAAALASALKQAGLDKTDELADTLAAELTEHARHVDLEDSERAELEAAGQPTYELPLIVEGIDIAALYRLARELREQGAA
jgi:anion-transporting  ArsA/GET3 family ATPase